MDECTTGIVGTKRTVCACTSAGARAFFYFYFGSVEEAD